MNGDAEPPAAAAAAAPSDTHALDQASLLALIEVTKMRPESYVLTAMLNRICWQESRQPAGAAPTTAASATNNPAPTSTGS